MVSDYVSYLDISASVGFTRTGNGWLCIKPTTIFARLWSSVIVVWEPDAKRATKNRLLTLRPPTSSYSLAFDPDYCLGPARSHKVAPLPPLDPR